MSYILALDQGTTSSRSILFEHRGTAAASAQREFPQIYPSPGHVEHDPEAIWETQLATARDAIGTTGADAADIEALGIANQRETVVLWERDSGKPVANAIVWQSRITAPLCEQLKKQGHEELFRARTGLVLDPYFSGTKIRHLLDEHDLHARAARGEILAGTIDSFLLWRLTGGEVHATDASNASRTLLFDIHKLDWDDELLEILHVPRAMLPEVRDSSGDFGHTEESLFGRRIPIAGIAGDQQAATFGQACFEPGACKNTYGTGCFILMNTGSRAVASDHGLLSTVGWVRGGQPTYCLEGSVFVGGAAVQWLRDGLGLIESSKQIEELAASEEDSGGVFLVPAFVGLGAPYWDPYARGLLIGLERSTTAGHVARATVESMAYQSLDVVRAMEADAGASMTGLRVDGGAAVNDALMQFQADLLGTRVQRPVVAETTALGAAYLAGLAVGFWADEDDVTRNWALDHEFEPQSRPAERDRLAAGWQRAVERSRGWAEP